MTQMIKARSGEITGEVRQVAEQENLSPEEISQRVASGEVVIPLNENRNRKGMMACGIGRGLKTKVNANTGTSGERPDIKTAVQNAVRAAAAGADTVMDLSTGGDIERVRRNILESIKLPTGTVPVYQAGLKGQMEHGAVIEMTEEDMFEAVERHAEDGVDFITVHCGINWDVMERLNRTGRLVPVVSRGGSFTLAWMWYHQKENPFYRQFGRLLEIAKRFDVTLSLGDGMRPGCIEDATDSVQVQELILLGELVLEARKASVQVMVEGPGHVPVNQVEANILMQKRLCHQAPFYVLGPLVTDIAPGYDHLVSSIGGAVASAAGADFLCFVTPDEHLSIPGPDSVEEGVMASRIAAHAGDLAKNVPGKAEWDRKMSLARKEMDWRSQEELAINPEKVARARCGSNLEDGSGCTMCGDFCAFKIMEKVFGEED